MTHTPLEEGIRHDLKFLEFRVREKSKWDLAKEGFLQGVLTHLMTGEKLSRRMIAPSIYVGDFKYNAARKTLAMNNSLVVSYGLYLPANAFPTSKRQPVETAISRGIQDELHVEIVDINHRKFNYHLTAEIFVDHNSKLAKYRHIGHDPYTSLPEAEDITRNLKKIIIEEEPRKELDCDCNDSFDGEFSTF